MSKRPLANAESNLRAVEQQSRAEVTIHQSQSPLPSPEILRGYQEIVPDLPERLMREIEAQSNHRRAMESMIVTTQTTNARRGLFLGFTFGVLIFAASLYAALKAGPWAGASVFGPSGVAALSLFLYRRRQQPPHQQPPTA